MKGAMNGAANNTAVGKSAMAAVTTGVTNVAVGSKALAAATACTENIAIGYQTAQALGVAEIGNIAIGANSMNSMDEGTNGNVNYNVAIGLESFLGGDLSTASTDVIGNIAIGAYALDATGTNAQTGTIAIGHQALTALTSGAENLAIGYQCMDAVDDGAENVAIGHQAMSGETSGKQSIAIGSEALKIANTTSSGTVGNVMIGHNNGIIITTGTRNTVVGAWSMLSNETGSNNTGLGYNALQACTASQNTMVGYQAGDGITTGANNTGIGYAVTFDVDADNQTAVGNGATTASTGVNTIMMGNGSMTDIYMGDDGNAWSQVSDERLKRNIEDWDVGLDAINKLRIRQFQFKEDNVFGFSADKVRHGVVAQEAVEALPEMISTNEKGWMSANNESMIWAMVNAVQELSAQVESLKEQLENK